MVIKEFMYGKKWILAFFISFILNCAFIYGSVKVYEAYDDLSKNYIKYNTSYYDVRVQAKKAQGDLKELLEKIESKENINIELFQYKWNERAGEIDEISSRFSR